MRPTTFEVTLWGIGLLCIGGCLAILAVVKWGGSCPRPPTALVCQ